MYNNFPWPSHSGIQKAKTEQTARAFLDTRHLDMESGFADNYIEASTPPELRKAYQSNDWAVMRAYGFSVKDMTERKCVAELMNLYRNLETA